MDNNMELPKLKEIRETINCDRKTCRGCENLKKCDFCDTNFCSNHKDERGEWGVIDDDDCCPICFARENFRRKKEGYKGSEEICKCGEILGTGKDCSYCKQFAESKTLGEHKK